MICLWLFYVYWFLFVCVVDFYCVWWSGVLYWLVWVYDGKDYLKCILRENGNVFVVCFFRCRNICEVFGSIRVGSLYI